MNTAFQVVTGIGFIICLVFVIAFHVKTGGAWRRSEAGRWLMLGRANFMLLFGLLLLAYVSSWFNTWAGARWIFLCVYGAFALQTLWPLRLLFHQERMEQIRRDGIK